jgi:hypothetical protein
MPPAIGDIVQTRPGAYSAQSRCAAIVTKVHDNGTVDLTVFPGDGATPFAIRAVKRVDAGYRELSNKEIFWHEVPAAEPGRPANMQER